VERSQLDAYPGTGRIADPRRCPRFKIDVKIAVRSLTGCVLEGHTVDISESGVGALLKSETPLGELVQLEFILPLGRVEIGAIVRQRNAFRYGFEFVEQGTGRKLIETTCRRLFVDQMILGDLVLE
jgi:hypothetical protein